ncbi:MAG: type II toxin-antitoxin system VapC family toxin [Bryobacteraceae bacterium]|nr:type II toxin-antitoxin system VapC family toxin [Bryobacteraceae bacterium]
MEAGSVVHLDTCAVLFLYAGLNGKFPPAAMDAIERGTLRISPMVLLELQYLREVGRFKHRAEDVLEELSKLIGLTVCTAPFPPIALAATRLEWTRDPFDRLITAQANSEQAPLVTADANIRNHYVRAIW